METILNVEGMTCNHCKQSVEGALGDVKGVTEVDVDLDAGKVTVEHEASVTKQTMEEAVEEQGYDIRA